MEEGAGRLGGRRGMGDRAVPAGVFVELRSPIGRAGKEHLKNSLLCKITNDYKEYHDAIRMEQHQERRGFPQVYERGSRLVERAPDISLALL